MLDGRRGEVKDAARQLFDCILFCFIWTPSELEITSLALCLNNALCAPCLEQVVGAVAEVSAVDLPLGQTTLLRWASLLPIYKPFQESRANSIPYVFIPHTVHSS